MGKKYCIYKGCRSDSRYAKKDYMQNVFFVPFPKPIRNFQKCQRWIKWLDRDDFPIERINPSTYLCSKHFVGGNGPSDQFPDPIHNQKEYVSILKPQFQCCALNDISNNMEQEPLMESNATSANTCIEMDCSNVQLCLDVSSSNKKQDSILEVNKDNNNTSIEMECSNENNTTMEGCSNENLTEKELEKPLDNSIEIVTHSVPDPSGNNIMEIFITFACPLGWSITMLADTFKVRKLDEETGIVLLGVSIANDFSTQYKVNGRILQDPSVLSKFPQRIGNLQELTEVVKRLSHMNVCTGNMEMEYVTIFKENTESSNFLSSKGGVHSGRCTLFLLDQKRKRCFYCLKLRATLRVTAKRRRNKLNTSLTPFKKLSKKELTSRLRESKINEIKLLAKVRRLRRKCERIITKKGEILDNEDNHNFLLNILETNVGESRSNVTQLTDKEIGDSRSKSNENFGQLFLKTQLKMLKMKNTKNRRWHPLVIQWCLFMYEKSPALYHVLEESAVLQLPSRSTLRRHATNIAEKTGFEPQVFIKMKEDFKKIRKYDHQDYFSLVLDEIKIQEDLVYRQDTGEIVGYVDPSNAEEKLSELNQDLYKDKTVASHVLQFMLRGLTSSFKVPFAYFPTSSLTAEKLDNLLWEAIRKLEICGFKILCVVGDGAAINRKCFKMNTGEANYKQNNPFSGTEERSVYFLFDVPHLIKTVRNCLGNSAEDSTCRKMEINGEKLTWDIIKNLYKSAQKKPGNFKKLYKLTDDHISLRNRMKVKYATQVLSQSVANALKLEPDLECPEMVRFIEIFNQWFDVMNVSNCSDNARQRNPNLEPFRLRNDWRLKWLDTTFLAYLNEWESYALSKPIKHTEQKKMMLSSETLSGLRQTTKCILELIPFLLDKGAKFVLTDHFNQDPLEHLFSKHRQACMAGSKPTLNQYARNSMKLKRLADGKFQLKIKGGNTNSK